MAHKILMLGGKRAGKTSILACILKELQSTPGNICTFNDHTDYTKSFIDKNGEEHHLATLSDKRIEISQYLRKLSGINQNNQILVNMSSTYFRGSYHFNIKIGDRANANFEFVDVPGEYMNATVTEHADLVNEIKEADVFIITIDTPYLMDADEDVNVVYNRISEITNAMSKLSIQNDLDKKLILFCPVKCEKWLNKNEGFKITDKVCQAYKTLINQWVESNNVDIWVMPVQTAGGIEFSKLLDGKLIFRSEASVTGESCSIDEVTNAIMFPKGTVERMRPEYRLEEDTQLKVGPVSFPLAWYKVNGKGFSPSLCEQPAYHILRFLVNKQKEIDNVKQKVSESKGWLQRLIEYILYYKSPFGVHVKEYSDMIDKMERQQLIKGSGDGFKKITEFIK